jgi:hypothetical protein
MLSHESVTPTCDASPHVRPSATLLPMASPPNISKSRFCTGLQCLRRLWWEVHEPDAPELRPDMELQAVFDRGHHVGELARLQFPGGALVDFDPWRVRERVDATRNAIASGAPAVFEASFAAGGVFAAVDVLERLADGWALVEVKSTYSVKDQFIPDVAIQLHAARAAGVDVRRTEVMHLHRIQPTAAEPSFVRQNVTARAEALQPAIPAQLARMRAALDGALPDIAPGTHCSRPYECPFQSRCGDGSVGVA